MDKNSIQSLALRTDGSVDTAFYLAQGRKARADQANHFAAEAVKMMKFWRSATG